MGLKVYIQFYVTDGIILLFPIPVRKITKSFLDKHTMNNKRNCKTDGEKVNSNKLDIKTDFALLFLIR